MTGTLDNLLRRYERGHLDRRHFLQAVTALAAVSSAPAAAAGVLDVKSLHHVEVKSLDFKRTGEFYERLFGVKAEVRSDRAVISFPSGAHLSIGSAPTQASIDHYAFSIAGYDGKNPKPVVNRLEGAGVKATPRGESLFVVDPDGRQVQIVPLDFKP